MRKEKQNNRIRKVRGRKLLLPFLLFLLLFSACRKEEEPEQPKKITVELPDDATKLYYLNEERTKVVSENYKLTFGDAEKQISELLTKLEDTLWTEDEKNLITDQNPIYEFKVGEDGLLVLRFAPDYKAAQTITEVLRRAAIVKTMCQLNEVSSVEFYIGMQPLMTSAGKPVGILTEKDFIDSTGENTEFYQEARVAVYFANEAGDALVESNLKITYDGKVSTERLILEQLLEGPLLKGMQAVIPEGTVLNKVTIRDGICYVDFNEKFMEKREGIEPEVAVYAIVNSLTELSNVYKVQFLINGAAKKTYYTLDFSSAFERNLEIVEGEQ
ncbi:MAG: GerMN domain-containing protein [Lachnospiraceae bacterium]|nr:GerMN domain-containing protein [Lachnospiraceae bacterium]MBP3611140.1 GerMN domain-containing protein [Lachnospiraceae bacterium]